MAASSSSLSGMAGSELGQLAVSSVVLGEGRAVLAHVEEQPAMADVIDDFLDATGELRPNTRMSTSACLTQ